MIDDLTGNRLKTLRTKIAAGNGTLDDCSRLAVLLTRVHHYSAALDLFCAILKHTPDYPNAALGAGLCLTRLGATEQAITYLNQALVRQPADMNVHKLLATNHGQTGNLAKAVQHGEFVLHSLDKAACRRVHTPAPGIARPPVFRSGCKEENIISFSLFGNAVRYIEGAANNTRQAGRIYPGWRCRFYCDDQVPKRAIKKLKALGAEVIRMGKLARPADGLFWRFRVINDPAVKRFLIRDCDSIITTREQAAVEEWLRSDRLFHVMRDYYSHTDLILAGMWGGVANALPDLLSLLKRFRYNPHSEECRIADQLFLGREVWPIIKSSCLIHDSIFSCFGAKQFPPGSELGNSRTVGDNDYLIRNAAPGAETAAVTCATSASNPE